MMFLNKNKPKNKNMDKNLKAGLVLMVTLIMSAVIFLNDTASFLLRTSVLGFPDHAPFDGTSFPVKKVPDWVSLSSARWDLSYTDLRSSELTSTPTYDASHLSRSIDTLTWGNANDDEIRNEKITYSVPYMGNYELDGKENAGSHLALDIKLPMRTPIFAVANGTVIKASIQGGGFGNHVVVQHNNVPTLNSSSAKETLYSSYSHMDSLIVELGDTVTRGEQIGLSGNTGTATTPHLHFQLDNDNAPWHPFWPFTWQEQQAAGLSFFEAVNAGLGKSKALAATENPMMWVQKYLDGSSVVVSASDEDEANNSTASYVPEVVEPVVVAETEVVETVVAPEVVVPEVVVPEVVEPEVVTPVVEEVVLDPPVLTFDFDIMDKYYVGQPSTFSVLLKDQYGREFEDGIAGNAIVSGDQGFITAKNSIMNFRNFDREGRAESSFTRMKEGKERLQLEYEGETYYSEWFQIVDDGSSLSFKDLDSKHEYYAAIMYLAKEDVIAGYPDGTFKPDQTVSRVEALKFILEGIKQALSSGTLPFKDTSLNEWYGKYLYTAYSRGVVDGYSDGTFKPANTVNRAEFYKILFNGMDVDVNPVVENKPYKDVPKDAWFAPYVAYAKQLGIIEEGTKELKPESGMTRGEVSFAIYKLMLAME